MDDNEENEFKSQWKSRVVLEINNLSQEPKTKKDMIKSVWKMNRDLVNAKAKERKDSTPTFQFNKEHFPSVCETANSKKNAKQMLLKKVVHQVGIIQLDAVEATPTFNMWVPITRNLLPDKETPTNIPYFGDEVIEKDSNFIASLVEEVMVTTETISDEKFLALVHSMEKYTDNGTVRPTTVLDHPQTTTETQYCTDTAGNHSLPKLIVFQAIASSNLELGSAEELIKRYKGLKKICDKNEFAPNIDGPEAANLSCAETLHTHKNLLCRRCYLYDCPLHRDDPVIDAAIPRTNPRELPIPTEPCGSRCYMNSQNKDNLRLLSPRTPGRNKVESFKYLYDEDRISKAKKILDPTDARVEVWSPAEKSMYRVYIKSFPGNFCAVAQVIATKMCDQVFEFSVLEGKTSRGRGEKKKKPKTKKVGRGQQAQLYKLYTEGGMKDTKRPYIPCYHPDQDCHPDVCSCRQNNNFCEKFCYCPVSCRDRFPGCRCKSNCKTSKCPCFLASRECDSDLCKSCLDGKFELDPVTNSCQNVYVQRMMGKQLFVAPSDIAGLGCFLGDDADKNDFIAEYVGEMITHEECESRGRVYDMAKSSYMFNLNEEYIVDAARLGGNIRFANHSSKPNCQVKILLVNGDHRIGIYAKEKIQKGEELFFNYGKDFVGHDLIEQ